MQNFEEKLEAVLKKDVRFVDQEGELLKSEVIAKAYKIDKDLIELLLENPEMEKKFFTEIKKHWVFDINTFIAYIQDKNFLADSYTKFKNKIGLNIAGKFLDERKEVSLVWPFKDCILEGGMTKEDEKRKEIFFNEILAQDEIDRLLDPKVLVNWKYYDKSGEHKIDQKIDFGKQNYIIKGNNLIALHTIKKRFKGKVKLIYIDPPYNTGNDSFGYNDSFNHSAWLTFMKNRLDVAKELLAENGSIFISVDDREQAYLKIVCDEVFERENFLADIIWNSTKSVTNTAIISVSHTHNLVYFKNINSAIKNRTDFRLKENGEGFSNPDNDSRGLWKADPFQVGGWRPNQQYEIRNPNTGTIYKPNEGCSWKNDFKKFQELLKDNRIIFGTTGDSSPQRKRFLSEALERGKVAKTIWDDVGTTANGTQHLNQLLKRNLFNNPKPELFIQRVMELATKEKDIILDFFAGSGTTCAVAHKMNRQYIGIEQMDYIHDLPEARLVKVIAGEQGGISKTVGWKGGGSFVYCELAKYNEKFMDEIQEADTTRKLVNIWNDIKEKGFMHYWVLPKEFDKNLEEFKKLSLTKQKEILIKILNKNQLYVRLSEIDDVNFKVSKEDKNLNEEFYK